MGRYKDFMLQDNVLEGLFVVLDMFCHRGRKGSWGQLVIRAVIYG
jgi:hypothetical protein